MHTYLHTTVCVCMDTYMYKCWNIIKQLLNSKGDAGLPNIFFIDSTEIKDSHFIAETFNSYFTNLGPTLAEKILNPLNRMMPHPPPCSLGLLPTSSLEIIQISSLLKNSTSPGIDGINPSIARSSISLVYTPLSWIFNSSFNLGLILDILKIEKITPIFKSCPKNLIYNLTNVCTRLPNFYKILEKLMVTRLSIYLDRFALLSPAQLLEMQTCISEAMNSNKYLSFSII